MRAALSSYVGKHDVLRCRVGGRPDDPRSDLAMMAYLVPDSGGSRVEGRRMVAMSSDRLEGGADVGLYGAQEQVKRCSFPTRFTVMGLLLQRLTCACTRVDGGHAVTVAGMAIHRPSAST
jgi:hypothetical protein